MLNITQTAIADANGNATVTVAPLRAFENWNVQNVSIESTGAAIPRFKIYVGGSFRGGTYSATFNNDSDPFTVPNGQNLVGQFSLATPGSTCSMTVTGETSK